MQSTLFSFQFISKPSRLCFAGPKNLPVPGNIESTETEMSMPEIVNKMRSLFETRLPDALVKLIHSDATKKAPEASEHPEDYYQEGDHEILGPQCKSACGEAFSGLDYKKCAKGLQRYLNEYHDANLRVDGKLDPRAFFVMRLVNEKNTTIAQATQGAKDQWTALVLQIEEGRKAEKQRVL